MLGDEILRVVFRHAETQKAIWEAEIRIHATDKLGLIEPIIQLPQLIGLEKPGTYEFVLIHEGEELHFIKLIALKIEEKQKP